MKTVETEKGVIEYQEAGKGGVGIICPRKSWWE